MDTQKSRLNEMVLWSTQNIIFMLKLMGLKILTIVRLKIVYLVIHILKHEKSLMLVFRINYLISLDEQIEDY